MIVQVLCDNCSCWERIDDTESLVPDRDGRYLCTVCRSLVGRFSFWTRRGLHRQPVVARTTLWAPP